MTIIKNYGMPHNCYDCDLHNYHECDLTGESIEEDYCWNGDKREKHCPLREVEAIPKADYENRLKADMVAMLTEMQLEIEELDSRSGYDGGGMPTFSTDYIHKKKVNELVQQKINALKGGKENNTALRVYDETSGGEICGNCLGYINQDFVYCPKCGYKLED